MDDKLFVPKIENPDILSDLKFEEKEIEEYKTVKRKRKKKQRRLRLLQLLVICVVIVVLLLVDVTNVKKIIVLNNHILSKEEVMNATNIHYKRKFPFIWNFNKKKAKNIFISDYTVKNNFLGEITIDVKEVKLIGYIIYEEKIEFISSDLKKISSDNLPDYIIRLPKINHMEEAFIEKISKYLSNLDNTLISRISEIDKFETSYDKNMVALTMEDGNKIYSSFEDLKLLDDYNKILETVSGKGNCIQLDVTTSSAFKFKCP